MASTTELSILVRVKDEATAAFSKIGKSLDGLGTAMAATGGVVVAGLTAAAKSAIEAETRMAAYSNQLKNAGNDQDAINGLVAQAEAIEKVGGVSKDAVLQIQQTIAEYDYQADVIGKLTPMIVDYTATQYGASASTENARQIANGFGKAMQGQFDLLTKSGFKIDESQKKMLQFGNEMERAATISEILGKTYAGANEALGGTTEGQLNQLTRSFDDLAESIGTMLLPILNQLLSQVAPVIQAVTDWMARNPELANTIVTIAAVLGPLMVILPGLVAAIAAIASPVGIAIVVIGALIAAGVLLYKHWDEVKAKAIEIWESVVDFFKTKWEALMAGLQAVADFFVKIWDGIVAAFKFSVALFVGILDAFLSLFDKNWKEHFMMVLAFFKQVWDNLQIVFTFFVTTILPKVVAFLTTLLDTINEYIEPIVNAFTTIWNSVKEVTSNILEGIKSVVLGVFNWIIDKLNSVIESINSVARAGAAIGGFSAPQIPNIPRLANGGIVDKPTIALIGEAGPEAVVPLSGNAGAGLGNNNNVTVNIGTFVGGSNPDTVARELGDLIIKRLQLNARVG